MLAGVIVIASLPTAAPTRAQDDVPIEPHLGYGIHIGPNASIGEYEVTDLRMDWVKIYDLGQASQYPSKRVLLRVDVRWQTDWDAFKNMITQTVQAARDLGVDAIEFGNEPNLDIEWGGRTPNAWEYVQVLRICYTISKQIAPSIIVVSAGLAPTKTLPNRAAIDDLDYAREMIENGADKWFDAFGYHPYGYNQPPEADPSTEQLVFRRTELIRNIMERAGVYKQIWLTEFGWLRDPNEDGINCSDSDPDFRGFAWLRVPGTTVGSYLVRAFDYAHKNWQWAGPMFVWNLNWNLMPWLPPCDHRRWFGLLSGSGNKTPAYQALQRMPHYYSNYQPKLVIAPDQPPTGKISLACLKKTSIGEFTINNLGYPGNIGITIEGVNGAEPPYVEIDPPRPRVGETIRVLIEPTGLRSPGQYPVYINIRTTVNGQPNSQSMQGFVLVTDNQVDCPRPDG